MSQSDQIFLIRGETISALESRPFRAGMFGTTLEDALQVLIEKHPSLLHGRRMAPDTDDPPRFVLLHREMPIGDWSLDHLFVDQAGILTLLEAKLVENPEARRAVIGQIIEYAANAAFFWRRGHLREKATTYWTGQGKNLDDLLKNEFGEQLDLDEFWNLVEENLQAGRIRLMIAADRLRPEVRRAIEYLSDEMKTAEVYGLEIQCYGEEPDSLVLVPYLTGRARSQTVARERPPAKRWTPELLRRSFSELEDQVLGGRLQELLGWAVDRRAFLSSRAMSPMFGIQFREGHRMVSVSPDWTYIYMDQTLYPDGAQQRDRLLAGLQKLELLPADLDPGSVASGRNLSRGLNELTPEQFSEFLEVLSGVTRVSN